MPELFIRTQRLLKLQEGRTTLRCVRNSDHLSVLVIWETVICTHHPGGTGGTWISATLKHISLPLNLLVTKEMK